MKSERGAVLSFVLMVVGVLSVLGMAMASLVRVDTMQQVAQENVTRNFLAAEAGINRGIGEFRNLFLDQNLPEGSDFDPHFLTIDGHNVRYQLQGIPTTPPPLREVTLPAGDAFAGLNSLQYRYSVRADDLHGDGNSRAGLGAQFTVNNVPIFQFLFFYTHDLEFQNPAAMDLHGRIHSNANLFINAGHPVTVTDSADIQLVQVSAAGSIYRGENLLYSGCWGNVTIDTLVDGDDAGTDLDPLLLECKGSATRLIPPDEAAAWQGSLLPGLGNITPPRFDNYLTEAYDRAEFRIALDLMKKAVALDGSCSLDDDNGDGYPDDAYFPIVVENKDGSVNAAKTTLLREFMWKYPGSIFYNDVPRTGACTGKNSPAGCANLPESYDHQFTGKPSIYRPVGAKEWSEPNEHHRCDYRRGGFFNNREKRGPYNLAGQGSWIYMLNIDLQALLDWNRAEGGALFNPDDDSDGGLVIFASVRGPASAGVNNYGVRLLDSAALGFPKAADPTGVTVVSDQAIYVQGDYNSIDKAPAAVIGDTVNVISQGWEANGNDLKSTFPLANRIPVATTINAAFIAGVDESTQPNPNGGVNNFPRMHEDWRAAIAFNYSGSMVSLARPVHQNGLFLGSGGSGNPALDMYYPPLRNWDYDADFDDAANLPPLTPRVVWVQQALFTQQFQ